MKRKELSKIQNYALMAANKKAIQAEQELQSIVDEIATELGVDLKDPNEVWAVSRDMKYLEKQEGKKEDKK